MVYHRLPYEEADGGGPSWFAGHTTSPNGILPTLMSFPLLASMKGSWVAWSISRPRQGRVFEGAYQGRTISV